MEQLLEANPSNASFLTPSSQSQLTQSHLSEHKQYYKQLNANRICSSSKSMDKYQMLKNDINRSQGGGANSTQPKRLFQQKSANFTTCTNYHAVYSQQCPEYHHTTHFQ